MSLLKLQTLLQLQTQLWFNQTWQYDDEEEEELLLVYTKTVDSVKRAR